MSNVVAIIPARGNSQRIPLKNIKIFHGKPIIAYPINTAIESKLFDRVIVSTDNQLIAAVAQQCGAEVIMRSEEMSKNEVGTQTVMAHVLKDIECEYACCIYPCAPMIHVDDLIQGRLALAHYDVGGGYKFDSGIVYAMSVNRNQDDCGNWYWGHSWAFIEGRPLDGSVVKVIIPNNRGIDINTMEDWERAEKMFAELHGITA